MTRRRRAVSAHQLDSVLYVARCIDAAGVSVGSADLAYRLALTGGTRSAEQLKEAESLLIAGGLLTSDGERVKPSDALRVLCALDDDQALLALRGALRLPIHDAAADRSTSHDMELEPNPSGEPERAAMGRAGEEYVVAYCREELIRLGRSDLASGVQQISLVSDSLGYDVVAPTMLDSARLLEVKTQNSHPGHTVRFFLTRNEYEVGRRMPNWAVVACATPEGVEGDVELIGWCRASSLTPYLPVDANGRWTEAIVRFPKSLLNPGAPEAI